jgi:aspartokinase/homoserine dehydrogenase 1
MRAAIGTPPWRERGLTGGQMKPLEPSPAAAPDETVAVARPYAIAHKFGGTSVADAPRYRHVAQLLRARDEPVQVTVVSAM